MPPTVGDGITVHTKKRGCFRRVEDVTDRAGCILTETSHVRITLEEHRFVFAIT
ncbi:hypothetical protein ACQ5SP_03720 [Rhodovulum sp. YNF3179]|uniref:hypothetical protein n=1 Tax=Rhodovulum sp. YNF3179 TaxID=3425127 RepID=UPI003D324F12